PWRWLAAGHGPKVSHRGVRFRRCRARVVRNPDTAGAAIRRGSARWSRAPTGEEKPIEMESMALKSCIGVAAEMFAHGAVQVDLGLGERLQQRLQAVAGGLHGTGRVVQLVLA